MAQHAHGKRRTRVRDLLATGKLDDATLDEFTSLVGSDTRAGEVDWRQRAPAMRPDDVIRLWALDRGAVQDPLPRNRPVPEEIRALFVQAQRVAHGDHLEDWPGGAWCALAVAQ